jgi:hypothetical protein
MTTRMTVGFEPSPCCDGDLPADRLGSIRALTVGLGTAIGIGCCHALTTRPAIVTKSGLRPDSWDRWRSWLEWELS